MNNQILENIGKYDGPSGNDEKLSQIIRIFHQDSKVGISIDIQGVPKVPCPLPKIFLVASRNLEFWVHS